MFQFLDMRLSAIGYRLSAIETQASRLTPQTAIHINQVSTSLSELSAAERNRLRPFTLRSIK